MNKLIVRSLFTAILYAITIAVFSRLDIHPAQKQQIYGIILPHHALANSIIDDSFNKLKTTNQPKTIVIFGTNHNFPVSDTYTTTAAIKNTYSLDGVTINDIAITNDHSIQTILPFTSKYFPDAKIVPILVSATYKSIEDMNSSCKKFIAAFNNQETLYIASVDFAHDVAIEEGLAKNRESVNSISSFNFKEIVQYKNDHLDSPLAITTLMLIMEQLNATSWQQWDSSHGSLMKGVIDLNSTSYVIGTFSTPTN